MSAPVTTPFPAVMARVPLVSAGSVRAGVLPVRRPGVARSEEVFDRLRRVCTSEDGAPAPLLGAPYPAEGRLRMYPYLLRADMLALLSWVGRLDRCPTAFAQPLADGAVSVAVFGRLGGVAVELVATTHRRVPGGPGLVELSVLLAVARVELEDLPSVVVAGWLAC